MRTVNFKFTKLLILLLMITAQACYGFNIQATPQKILWQHWKINNPLSTATINHSLWQHFLDKYVVTNKENIALVNYAGVSPTDKSSLNDYISQMSGVKIENYNRNEQLAYWINLYNALVIKLILDHYPVSSIQDINISPGIFNIGPWDAKVVLVDKLALSLNDIKHHIIRPFWNEPRIHYALNCGAIGCPNLSHLAYQGQNLNSMLNTAAKTYINSLRGVQVIEGKVVASRIFEWYHKDFGATEADEINHMIFFANQKLKNQLAGHTHISDYIYNWHLNEVTHG